jgi:hypothetical protein
MSKGSNISKSFMRTAKAMQGRNAGSRHQRRAIAKLIKEEHKKNGRVRED